MARTPFDDHLARLSRRDRTAFVGALLRARGWDVDVDPPVVRATRGDERQVVAVAHDGFVPLPGRGLPGESVDVVVGVDADQVRGVARKRDARVWDASTLYEMARYGLDRASADDLFREHFGVASDAVGRPSTDGAATDTPDAATSARGPGRVPVGADRPASDSDAATGRPSQWVVPVVLLLGVVLVGGGLVVQAWADAPAGASSPDSAAPTVPDGEGDAAASTATRTATSVSTPRRVLPGLTTAGIDDTAVLSRAHAAALEDRSFTMHLRYTERVGDETVGTAREVVRVENRTVYRSRGTQSGSLTADLVPVIVRDLYADGDGRYLREGDGALRVGDADDPGTGQVVERSRALVAWYLSGDRSALVDRIQRDDETYYRVSVAGTTDRRFEDYRATGFVTEWGLVVRVDATYRLPESDRVATVTLRHERVGNTTVDRPEWMPPGNETAG